MAWSPHHMIASSTSPQTWQWSCRRCRSNIHFCVCVKYTDTDLADSLATRPQSSISVLISVNGHYNRLISEYASNSSGKSKSSKHLSPQQVSEVIKSGYETLSIKSKDGLDNWDKFREVDDKVFLKRFARIVVEDVKEKRGEEVF